jgi:hypothetical protein
MRSLALTLASLLCAVSAARAQERRPGVTKRWEGASEFLAYSEFTARVATRSEGFWTCGCWFKAWVEYTVEVAPEGLSTKVYVSACVPKKSHPVIGRRYHFICRKGALTGLVPPRGRAPPNVLIVEAFTPATH